MAQKQEKLKQEEIRTETLALKRTLVAMELNQRMEERYGGLTGTYNDQMKDGLNGAYKQIANTSQKLLSEGNYRVTDYKIKKLDQRV